MTTILIHRHNNVIIMVIFLTWQHPHRWKCPHVRCTSGEKDMSIGALQQHSYTNIHPATLRGCGDIGHIRRSQETAWTASWVLNRQTVQVWPAFGQDHRVIIIRCMPHLAFATSEMWFCIQNLPQPTSPWVLTIIKSCKVSINWIEEYLQKMYFPMHDKASMQGRACLCVNQAKRHFKHVIVYLGLYLESHSTCTWINIQLTIVILISNIHLECCGSQWCKTTLEVKKKTCSTHHAPVVLIYMSHSSIHFKRIDRSSLIKYCEHCL